MVQINCSRKYLATLCPESYTGLFTTFSLYARINNNNFLNLNHH